MPSLSTHVLDAAAGGGRPGVAVTVTDAAGAVVAAGVTDATGRIAPLAADLLAATYRVVWATGGDFVVEVAVTLQLAEERHYHVPLLSSPFAAVSYLGT